MAGKNGGARPGAGRKPKSELYERPIRRAEKQIVDRLPQLVDKMLVLAAGVLVEDVNPVTGEVGVYREAPNLKAIEYLLNRIMGKPTERHEHQIDDFSQLTDAELQAIIAGKSRG